MSVLPISANRPPSRNNRNEASTNSPAKAVEHHVDTLTTRHRPETTLELPRPRRGQMIGGHTQPPQHPPFGGMSGREHLQPQMSGDTHRRHTHPARGRMNQHPLTGPDTGQIPQRVQRGPKHRRHRRRSVNDHPRGTGTSSRCR